MQGDLEKVLKDELGIKGQMEPNELTAKVDAAIKELEPKKAEKGSAKTIKPD